MDQYPGSVYIHLLCASNAVQLGHLQTFMPRMSYAGMKVEDLGAIFDYLKTIEPYENQVVKFDPPKKTN